RASRDTILDDGLAIRGRVLDGDRPVADGLVRLQENESDSMNGSVRTARTGPDGSFSFTNCVIGRRYALKLLDPDGTRESDETAVHVHPEQGDVVLQIRKSKAELGSLAGRLEGTVAGHR